jgi:hypothetical protein
MCFEGFYGVSMVLGVAGVLKSIGETSGVETSQVASHWASIESSGNKLGWARGRALLATSRVRQGGHKSARQGMASFSRCLDPG